MSKKHQRISAPPCHGFADLEETQFDTDRERRCGFPEVVYAEGKTAEMLLKIFHLMRAHGIAGLATRVAPEKAERLRAEFPEGRYNETARTFRLPETKSQGNRDQKHQGRGNKGKSTKRVGKVAVITAGTSDLPVAEE
ncbi:MAG TPA: hypothetical protein DEB39_16040, partial [Planctomycetaceae bacterium]|nr:hypothetical protein [Planctomycetaceae bacterium]